MAFKNFDVAKRFAIGIKEQNPEVTSNEEVSALKKKSAAPKKVSTKRVSSAVKVDLKDISAKAKKCVNLNIRITEETKNNIENLAKRYGISQSDLVTALVNSAMKQE